MKKNGVLDSEIVMPAGSDWSPTRADLWNTVELKKRADAQVAMLAYIDFLYSFPDIALHLPRQLG